jgi:hypothetical protein
MMWPFRSRQRKPSRDQEIETLKSAVSSKRTELYKNLVKLDDATKSIEAAGVRVMLGEMFHKIDEGKKRD